MKNDYYHRSTKTHKKKRIVHHLDLSRVVNNMAAATPCPEYEIKVLLLMNFYLLFFFLFGYRVLLTPCSIP